MSHVVFLRQHGYLILFAIVLADQSGLPIPAAPFLVAAGALIHDGTLNAWILFACALLAAMLGHALWYYAGRRHGLVMLRHVCRLSLQPDACMRRTQDFFSKLSPSGLIAVRFVPGLDTMMQPLAGLTGMPPGRYWIINLCGAALWVGSWLCCGALFGEQLGAWLAPWRGLRAHLLPVLLGALALYVGLRLLQRQRALLRTQTPRIAPAQLRELLGVPPGPVVIDLRTALEARLFPRSIPGAVRLGRRRLEQVAGPDKARPVVLFCSCPHEFSAARASLRLQGLGWRDVRPLQGGLSAWQAGGHPVVRLAAEPLPARQPLDPGGPCR